MRSSWELLTLVNSTPDVEEKRHQERHPFQRCSAARQVHCCVCKETYISTSESMTGAKQSGDSLTPTPSRRQTNEPNPHLYANSQLHHPRPDLDTFHSQSVMLSLGVSPCALSVMRDTVARRSLSRLIDLYTGCDWRDCSRASCCAMSLSGSGWMRRYAREDLRWGRLRAPRRVIAL